MKIVLAADHAGFDLKEKIKENLLKKGYEVADCGAFSSDRSDYPDFAKVAAKKLSKQEAEMGVFVCGSGIGMCIVANRAKGVRAVVLHDEEEAALSRRHNDANAACFGARFIDETKALKILDVFMTTKFEGGRHKARIEKIDGEAK